LDRDIGESAVGGAVPLSFRRGVGSFSSSSLAGGVGEDMILGGP